MDKTTLSQSSETSSVAVGGPFGPSVSAVDHSLDTSSPSDRKAIKPGVLHSSENDECFHQLINLPSNKVDETHGHQNALKDPVMDMHTKLQKVQVNRDVSDLRLKDSKDHVEEMEKMLHLIEEVQVTKRCGDLRLQKAEEEALILNRKMKSLEILLNESNRPCSAQYPQSSTVEKTNDERRLLNLPAKRHFNKEYEVQRHQLPRQPLNQERVEENKEESVENLIACIGQEMAVLSDRLSSSADSSVSLIVKLDLLKKLIEKLLSVQESQVVELKKTSKTQENRCSFLEEELIHLQSPLNAKEEKEKTKYLCQTCIEHQQNGLQEVRALRGQHTLTSWKRLCRSEQEKTYLQALLDQNIQERVASQENLAEKEMELVLEQQESEQHLASMGEAQQQETQYISTSYNLHQENILLKDQLNHLKTELDHHKLSLAALEHEKCELQASEAEHVRRVQEEILEKQQLSVNLEEQGLLLLTLTEEHKELQLLYRCKIKESEGVVLQLQNHLKHVQAELDQVKCTLRTLEQRDDNGFQVACCMQKEITAKRRQIDSLQSKIQHLEETKENISEELVHQKRENKHQFQELALVRAEKKQFAKELKAVKSRNKHLSEQIREFEIMISQMSGGFTGCQEFIEQQEQEYCRLKLKHILDQKQVRPFPDLGPQIGAQHGEISKKHRPHTSNAASSVCRRRSAPERVQSTAFSCDESEVISGIQRIIKHGGSKSHLKTKELQHILICQEPLTSTPAASMTSPQLLGRRSPVHALLTSKPPNSL